jgi:hypothetical protein
MFPYEPQMQAHSDSAQIRFDLDIDIEPMRITFYGNGNPQSWSRSRTLAPSRALDLE